MAFFGFRFSTSCLIFFWMSFLRSVWKLGIRLRPRSFLLPSSLMLYSVGFVGVFAWSFESLLLCLFMSESTVINFALEILYFDVYCVLTLDLISRRCCDPTTFLASSILCFSCIFYSCNFWLFLFRSDIMILVFSRKSKRMPSDYSSWDWRDSPYRRSCCSTYIKNTVLRCAFLCLTHTSAALPPILCTILRFWISC